MKNIKKLAIAITMIFSIAVTSCNATIKNAKTQTIKVSGNCDMCKERIEGVATKKGISSGIWNVDSKMLSLTFDSTKTNVDKILKEVAYAGHDNEKFLAPDDVYADLPGCCQYTREQTVASVTKTIVPTEEKIEPVTQIVKVELVSPISEVKKAYFSLKDALAADDGTTASSMAKELFKAIDKVKMEGMSTDEHKVWMALKDKISYDAEHIKGTTELEHQREHFIALSKNMYELMKAFKTEEAVYYQHCPMANDGKGADWLSLQAKISNPYMGKSMPTCGKVVETIKK